MIHPNSPITRAREIGRGALPFAATGSASSFARLVLTHEIQPAMRFGRRTARRNATWTTPYMKPLRLKRIPGSAGARCRRLDPSQGPLLPRPSVFQSFHLALQILSLPLQVPHFPAQIVQLNRWRFARPNLLRCLLGCPLHRIVVIVPGKALHRRQGRRILQSTQPAQRPHTHRRIRRVDIRKEHLTNRAFLRLMPAEDAQRLQRLPERPRPEVALACRRLTT
jgi:hypothetical protein